MDTSFKARLDALIKTRQARFSELRAMVDTAEGESRSFNAVEAAQFTTIESELASLDDNIHTLSDIEERSARAAGNPILNGEMYGRGSTPKGENRAGQWLAAEIRGLTGASGAGAAFTPAENATTFFDLLTSSSAFLASGVRQISTERDSLVIPRLTADTTSGWWNEGDTISSTDLAGDSVTAIPRKLASSRHQ